MPQPHVPSLLSHLEEIKQRLFYPTPDWISVSDPLKPISLYFDGILAPHQIFAIKAFCDQQGIPYKHDESGLYVNIAALAIALHLTLGFR
jgi:hypothetical protein